MKSSKTSLTYYWWWATAFSSVNNSMLSDSSDENLEVSTEVSLVPLCLLLVAHGSALSSERIFILFLSWFLFGIFFSSLTHSTKGVVFVVPLGDSYLDCGHRVDRPSSLSFSLFSICLALICFTLSILFCISVSGLPHATLASRIRFYNGKQHITF